MDKIIDKPNVSYTTYNPDCPFDTAEDIIERVNRFSNTSRLSSIMEDLLIRGGLSDFGKKMYLHIDYTNTMNSKELKDKNALREDWEWIPFLVYPQYPEQIGFFMEETLREEIKTEHKKWLENQHQPRKELSSDEEYKVLNNALKEMTMGVIDLDKVEK